MRETGVGIQDPLFFIGVVENNVDERLEGRVQVRAFGVHGTNAQVPTESLPWATLIHGSYDPNAPVPPVDSFVFGFFIDGRDAQQPMILGLIPTQLLDPINPEITGWGAIPERNANILSRGYRPTDIGQPVIAREARGEDISNTYVLLQEMNRKRAIPTASIEPDGDSRVTFSEPAPAYNAEYPFNRVIRSGSNIIELDDTPGSERIMIYHEKSGSYVSIDSRGTTVNKVMGDSYEIDERNQHVYVGGCSNITIMGNSNVLIKGNKVEEIEGDLIQNVRGNHLLSVGGQMNLNAGEDIQVRGAKLRIEANVEGVNIKANRNIRIESGEFMNLKSGATSSIEATDAININAVGENVNIQAGADFNFKSNRAYITAGGALDLHGGHVKIGGGSKVSVNASIVAIDDIIQLAEGSSVEPDTAGDAGTAEPAEATELPEPVSRGVTITSCGRGTLNSIGYTSTDESTVSGFESSSSQVSTSGSQRLTNVEVSNILSGPEPDLARQAAESFLGRPLSDTEWNNLVAATVAESLPNSPEEQAAIMAVILNRVRSDKYPNTVTEVLLQRNQFQAVTGTSANPGPSSNFTNPSERQMASTIRGVNQYLGTMDQSWLNFTSNITAAYGAGTNIGFRDEVRSSDGSRVIGGTVFGTV